MALLPELWPVGGCGNGTGPSDGHTAAQRLHIFGAPEHTVSSSVHFQRQLHKLRWASDTQTLGLEEAGKHKIQETPSGN